MIHYLSVLDAIKITFSKPLPLSHSKEFSKYVLSSFIKLLKKHI